MSTVDLKELFEMQKELDRHIVEKQGLEGEDLLPNKILALQVELGELANEFKGFKHWKVDPQPNREKMLEEFVDCLHFVLSIGLEIGFQNLHSLSDSTNLDCSTVEMFSHVYESITDLSSSNEGCSRYISYIVLFMTFNQLGGMLGFTWEEIKQAYMDKNKTNHERQERGY